MKTIMVQSLSGADGLAAGVAAEGRVFVSAASLSRAGPALAGAAVRARSINEISLFIVVSLNGAEQKPLFRLFTGRAGSNYNYY
jgi:riboflavin biosynthesis pyrimidine reductase